jgi:hypothetical protein
MELKNPHHRVDFPSEPINKRTRHVRSRRFVPITGGTRFACSSDE